MRRPLLTTLAVVALAAPALPAAAGGPNEPGQGGRCHTHADGTEECHGPDGTPAEDRARGVVFDGLAPADDQRCTNGYAFAAPGLAHLCTHGPDAAPPDVADVRTAETAPASSTEVANGPDLLCDGDGTSGRRWQAIYAWTPSSGNRYATYAASLELWAAKSQDELRRSSLLHDAAVDPRTFRFVHSPTSGGSCSLDVAVVALTDQEAQSFNNSISAVGALGFDRTDRNYLLWVDDSVYCGIGTLYGDDATTGNYNDRAIASYSRADTGCWDYAESHEMMHNIGAVQLSAPNSSGNYHCNDDRDVMCYSDGGSSSSLFIDPNCSDAVFEQRFDCNGDDYFNPSPSSGSYLSSHWNTWNSSWLHDVVSLDPGLPTVSIMAPSDNTTLAGTVTVAGTSADDVGVTSVTVAVAGQQWPTTPDGNGDWSVDVDTAALDEGAATIVATAADGDGNQATDQVTATIDNVADPVTDVFTGSLNKKRTSVDHAWTAGDGRQVLTLDDGTTGATTAGAKPDGKGGGGGGGKGGGGNGGGGNGGGDTTTWTLTLRDADGVVTSTTGSGLLTLEHDGTAGAYTATVSGGKGGYTLTVEHL